MLIIKPFMVDIVTPRNKCLEDYRPLNFGIASLISNQISHFPEPVAPKQCVTAGNWNPSFCDASTDPL